MLKFGEFICKHKKIILVISILLLIPSILGIKATKINYDILVYLPSDIETVQIFFQKTLIWEHCQ